jgi:hypothetical protein
MRVSVREIGQNQGFRNPVGVPPARPPTPWGLRLWAVLSLFWGLVIAVSWYMNHPHRR